MAASAGQSAISNQKSAISFQLVESAAIARFRLSTLLLKADS